MMADKRLALANENGAEEPISDHVAVSDADAEAAVRKLIIWAGEDPDREGLKETPKRYLNAWKEFFGGYKEDPRKHLRKTFADVNGYKDPITLQNIALETYCEHHLVPFVGEAFISYIPEGKVVGVSKLIRLLNGYAKRMQIQERLTSQVAEAIYDELAPRGVAVAIRSEHFCMTTRGVHKPGAQMLTTTWLGEFSSREELRREFMMVVNSSRYKAL